MGNTQHIQLPSKLANLMKSAAETGMSLSVTIDDRRYRVVVVEDHATDDGDLWSSYDADAVRAAIQRSKSMNSHADPVALDALIADIRAPA